MPQTTHLLLDLSLSVCCCYSYRAGTIDHCGVFTVDYGGAGGQYTVNGMGLLAGFARVASGPMIMVRHHAKPAQECDVRRCQRNNQKQNGFALCTRVRDLASRQTLNRYVTSSWWYAPDFMRSTLAAQSTRDGWPSRMSMLSVLSSPRDTTCSMVL